MAVKERPAQVSSGDILYGTYELKFHQEVFTARVEGIRIEFSFSDEPGPLGYIRLGGSRSGAIWIGAECIAEFEEVEGKWSLTPVSQGRKHPDQAVDTDPVTYLLHEAVTRRKR